MLHKPSHRDMFSTVLLFFIPSREKHTNERKKTNNKAGNEWLQALENRPIGQMGCALEITATV